MNAFDFFDNIYYLNLDSRPDRKESILEQAQILGIIPIRIQALSPADLGHDNHHLAFNASCMKALKEMQGDNVLLLEDDCVLRSVTTLEASLKQLPKDYDMVFLGANIQDGGVEMYSPNLVSYNSGWTTHAVGYSRECIEFIKGHFNPDQFPIYDEWIRLNVLPRGRSFVACPMVADQLKGFSDIWQGNVDYGFFNAWGNKMKVG